MCVCVFKIKKIKSFLLQLLKSYRLICMQIALERIVLNVFMLSNCFCLYQAERAKILCVLSLIYDCSLCFVFLRKFFIQKLHINWAVQMCVCFFSSSFHSMHIKTATKIPFIFIIQAINFNKNVQRVKEKESHLGIKWREKKQISRKR